jgi:uncharacterized membrane protein
MSKRHVQKKQSNVVTHKGQGVTYEQNESFDDSLLPDAIELEKLKALDSDIIHWIKARTEKEQDARLDFNNRKMSLIEKSQTKAFTVDIISLVLAFIIIMIGMCFSYFLIKEDQIVTGTIFAGATILLAANSFLNFRKKLQVNNPK